MARGKKPVPEASEADLELFASFVKAEERKEREAKAAAKAERRQADEHARLVTAKEDAAALVKRLRSSDRATAEEKAAADAAYKAALAAVVAAETGEAPTWAPPAPAADEGDGSEPSAASEDEAAEAAEEPSEPTEDEGAADADDDPQ